MKKDNSGNKIILDLTVRNKRITLINLYGPNRDNPCFYDQIRQDVIDFDNNFNIITGDFNLIMDPVSDCKNYIHVNNPKAREKVIDICAEHNLIDIWREFNMEKRQFSWRTKNGNKHARLDLFLISESLFTDTQEVTINPGYRSDHSMVILKLKGSEKEKKRSFWKFNNSILKDPEYVKIIKKVIEDTKKQYLDTSQVQNTDVDNILNKDIQLNISDQLFLEVLLMEIRGKTISYTSHKTKDNDNKERKLIDEIAQLETQNNAHCEILDKKRKELGELRKKKIEGVMIRSRAKWIDQGEKASKYFCTLENRNYVSKCMPNLWKTDGTKTNSKDEILIETKNFYEKLYEAKPIDNIDLNEILNYPNIPKLNESEKMKLEGPLTINEVLESLKNMKNNKSPGSDGFTAEFFKFFWKDLGDFVVRSINDSFVKGELASTQKEGVITCIPKGQKDKQYLKNWRPISLLNVVYKIASACIANRIKTVLQKLIHEDQTGFISGRYIGENIRNIYDILFYTEKQNIPGLLLLIDFEKAFDSVAWSFVDKVLDFFNFGTDIKKWINTFYNNIKSCVIVNGQPTGWFNIYRGCRQGDPLSPYIYILCAEILPLMIKNSTGIRGIVVGEKQYLTSLYADDTTIFLDGSEGSLKYTLSILKFYAKASGLHINIDKTRVLWLGNMKGSNTKLCKDINLCWDQGHFTALGVNFSLNLHEIPDINYGPKVREIKNLLLQWSKRILTPYGRILVVKCLAMAKINHLILSLPNPSEKVIKELNSLFFKFIWNGAIDRIKRKISIKTYNEGGLKMINMEYFVQALKVSWIRRLLQKDTKWSYLLNIMYPNILDFPKFGTDYIKQKLKTADNKFWKDVFEAWINFSKTIKIHTWEDFLTQPVWLNNIVKVGGKSIFYRKFFEKGIIYIQDFYNDNGQLLDLVYYKDILGIQTSFIEIQGLKNVINNIRNNLNIPENRNAHRPMIPLNIKLLLRDKKGCQRIYKILSKNEDIPTAQSKWQNDLTLPRNFKWYKVYNLPYIITKDTQLRWFQYRLVHRILATNTFLSKIGIKNDNKCTFCNNDPETLIHLFWNCETVATFWHDLTVWLVNECAHITNLNLTLPDIILGIHNKQRSDEVLNFIILNAKSYIYNMKYNNSCPQIQNFKKYLFSYYETEKYIAYSNCQWNKFDNRWRLYKVLFNHNPRDV